MPSKITLAIPSQPDRITITHEPGTSVMHGRRVGDEPRASREIIMATPSAADVNQLLANSGDLQLAQIPVEHQDDEPAHVYVNRAYVVAVEDVAGAA